MGRTWAGGPDDTEAADAQVPDSTDLVGDDAAVCGIAAGLSPALDGTDDMAGYPTAQQLTPGAMLGSDAAAIAWDRTNLYITVTSNAFTAAYEPLHVYLEAADGDLHPPAATSGKEYGGLTAVVPFSPTQLIAVRRVSDSGTSGGYDGVYTPGDGFTTRGLALESETYVSADQKTLSVRVPWTALGGCPTSLRLALHVVHGQVANEWKDVVPSTHTPWQTPGGGYYEIDLTGETAVSAWTLR